MFNIISKRRNILKKKNRKNWKLNRPPIKLSRILLSNPVKKSTVLRVRIATPRKPNSARRKIVKTKTSLLQIILTYVPGGSHNLKKFSQILIIGRGPRDLPGIYSRAIRGSKDLEPVFHKTKRRSIYGLKKIK